MDVLVSFLVLAYLGAGIRRVYVAKRPSFPLKAPYQKHFPNIGAQRPFFAVMSPGEDEEQREGKATEEEETLPLFPPLSPRPRGDLDLAFGEVDLAYASHEERNGEKGQQKEKDKKRNPFSEMLNSFLGGVQSLFSPQDWKSAMKKSKFVKGKTGKSGMEPFKKPGRASDWMKRDKH